MYRFKTKEEFIRDNGWNDAVDLPLGWGRKTTHTEFGFLKDLVGQPVPSVMSEYYVNKSNIPVRDSEKMDHHVTIRSEDYILVDTNFDYQIY